MTSETPLTDACLMDKLDVIIDDLDRSYAPADHARRLEQLLEEMAEALECNMQTDGGDMGIHRIMVGKEALRHYAELKGEKG